MPDCLTRYAQYVPSKTGKRQAQVDIKPLSLANNSTVLPSKSRSPEYYKNLHLAKQGYQLYIARLRDLRLVSTYNRDKSKVTNDWCGPKFIFSDYLSEMVGTWRVAILRLLLQ